MHPRATRPGVVLLPKSLVPVALAAAASAGFLLAFFFVLPFYTANDPARTSGRGASASWLWPARSRHPPSLSSPLPSIATTADADTDDALHLLPPSAPFPVPSSTPAADARPMAEVSTAQRVTDNGDEDRSCTIIINVYRGNPEALRIQLNQSLHQTDNVSVTHVWVTSFASPNSGQYRAVVDAIRANNSANPASVDFIESGFNFKFHGRFLLGLMAPTRYILMLDDDASISTTTVRNCINNINTPGRRGVYGGFGHLRASPERGTKYVFWPEESVDWKLHPDYYELDYLSRYWCFETAWLDYFAKERPWTWETGEDMHLSLAVRKFLNLNSYGTKLASGAPHLPGKSYTATKGGYVEMREHLFDHTVGRGNKIADIRPTIDTLVYVEDASHIERLMELLDACPGAKAENQSVTTNATQAASGQAAGTPPQPWAWPCALGRVAAVYRGSGADQDVPALAAAARRLCAHTHCESHALRLYDSRHPISHFDLRQDFGHERDAVPPATSAADLVPTLAGVLQNVAPTAFVYAEVAADAEIVGVRRVDGKAWTRGKYGVYRSAVRLAFDAYMGTRRNVKFSERDALPGDGGGGDDDDDDAFPTTKAYSWRGGAVVYPH